MSPSYVPTPPEQTALLLIECQNGIIGPDAVLPELARDAAAHLPTIGRLARGAREHGVQVVHLLFNPLLGTRSANRKPRLFNGVVARMTEWHPGDRATQPVDEVARDDRDLVLTRSSGLSPTHGTETFPILRNLGVRTVVVAGVSTNIAIPVVLTNAVDEGFDVLVARDAAVGSPADYAEAMMRHTIAMISRITTVDELLAQWGASTGRGG